MTNQENLKKVAKEGFDLLEEFLLQNNMDKTRRHEKSIQKSYPYRINFPILKTIDCNRATKIYGGVLILDAQRK